MNRETLPYRLNCEGYLVFGDKIIARNTEYGYIDFPGGGVDEGEEILEALKREVFEETGAIISNLKEVGVIKTIWPSDWAKNEKQKKRFEKYKGDEMHFFVGKVDEFKDPLGDKNEQGEKNNGKWDKGERLMNISEAIKIITGYKPFPEALKEYYEFKIKVLKSLLRELSKPKYVEDEN